MGHPRTGDRREHAPGPEPLIPQGLRSPPPDSPGGFSRELFPETGARRWALPAAALGPSRGSIPPTYPRMCDDLVSSFVDAGGKKCRAQQGRRGKSPSSGAGDGGVPAWGGGAWERFGPPHVLGRGGQGVNMRPGVRRERVSQIIGCSVGSTGFPAPQPLGPAPGRPAWDRGGPSWGLRKNKENKAAPPPRMAALHGRHHHTLSSSPPPSWGHRRTPKGPPALPQGPGGGVSGPFGGC